MKVSRQEHILNYLKKSIEKNRISHAYLFEGTSLLVDGRNYSDKKEVALWFAKKLEHSNNQDEAKIIQECKKRNKKVKKISINQIRSLKKHLNLSSFNSPYKIAIIDPAEKMTSQAINALLKTLEEPTSKTVLILIANISSSLPDTIISRCEKIKFRSIPLDKISSSFIHQDYIDILKKPLSDIFKFLEKISKDEKETISFLDSLLFWLRKKIVEDKPIENKSSKDFIKVLKETQRIKNLIATTNIDKKLALENLILKLI